MRAFTPEISWHNRLPALALDVSGPLKESRHTYRLATGGNDCRVYIWLIDTQPLIKNGKQNHATSSKSHPDIRIRAGLRRHQKSIGAVRFSNPEQNLLASGDDDGYIYIWKLKCEYDSSSQSHDVSIGSLGNLDEDGFEDLETWQQDRVLRGHIEDICDLAWSKDGRFLLSGSVDNSAILWDTTKGTKVWCSDLIKGYVQGVTIDPHAQFMAAISSDRALRIYNLSDKRLVNATRRMTIKANYKAFFCDDTVQTFCRRFEFSPDGQFIVAPTSKMAEDTKPSGKPINVILLFRRPNFSKPTHYYQTGKEVALCIRFCPVVFKLRTRNETNFWGIPYRLIFAVATARSVIIYDSQQQSPIGYVSQIHLARLTDLAWSSDARILMISSYDGYSTLLTFDKGEFGEVYDGPLWQPEIKDTKTEEATAAGNVKEEVSKRKLKDPPTPKHPKEPPSPIPEAATMLRFLVKRKSAT